MRVLICGLSLVALAACSQGERTYEMSVETARNKLLAKDFKRGTFPGSEKFKPDVSKDTDGSGALIWTVLNESKSGSWCPLRIEPVGEDGKRVKVINECKGLTASSDNKRFDELVDATLTGRPPKFD